MTPACWRAATRPCPWRCRPAVGRLPALLASGRVRVPIAHELPLDQAAEPPRLLESRAVQGKLVLLPWE